MHEIRVTGLRLAESALDVSLGIRARFDCVLGPVVIENCRLRIGADGRAVAVMPRLKDAGASLRFLVDKDHHRLTKLAGAAYESVTSATTADDA